MSIPAPTSHLDNAVSQKHFYLDDEDTATGVHGQFIPFIVYIDSQQHHKQIQFYTWYRELLGVNVYLSLGQPDDEKCLLIALYALYVKSAAIIFPTAANLKPSSLPVK